MCRTGAWVHFKIFYATPTLLNPPLFGYAVRYDSLSWWLLTWHLHLKIARGIGNVDLKWHGWMYLWHVQQCHNGHLHHYQKGYKRTNGWGFLLGLPSVQEPSDQHPLTGMTTGIYKGIHLVGIIYWLVGLSPSRSHQFQWQWPLLSSNYPWVKCHQMVQLHKIHGFWHCWVPIINGEDDPHVTYVHSYDQIISNNDMLCKF